MDKGDLASAMAHLLRAQKAWGQAKSLTRSASIQRINFQRVYPRFLLADDNNFVRQAVSRQVKNAFKHCSLCECVDGTEAANELKNNHDNYDYAILDNQMPGMEGIEVIRVGRAFERTRGLHRLTMICTADCAR